MKRLIFCFLFVLASSLYAGDLETVGQIKSIDSAKSQFTMTSVQGETMTFACTPFTEIEWKKKLVDTASFKDLKVNMWVEVEYISGVGVLTAKEVKLMEQNK